MKNQRETSLFTAHKIDCAKLHNTKTDCKVKSQSVDCYGKYPYIWYRNVDFLFKKHPSTLTIFKSREIKKDDKTLMQYVSDSI
jgi:hypothetical protein